MNTFLLRTHGQALAVQLVSHQAAEVVAHRGAKGAAVVEHQAEKAVELQTQEMG